MKKEVVTYCVYTRKVTFVSSPVEDYESNSEGPLIQARKFAWDHARSNERVTVTEVGEFKRGDLIDNQFQSASGTGGVFIERMHGIRP